VPSIPPRPPLPTKELQQEFEERIHLEDLKYRQRTDRPADDREEGLEVAFAYFALARRAAELGDWTPTQAAVACEQAFPWIQKRYMTTPQMFEVDTRWTDHVRAMAVLSQARIRPADDDLLKLFDHLRMKLGSVDIVYQDLENLKEFKLKRTAVALWRQKQSGKPTTKPLSVEMEDKIKNGIRKLAALKLSDKSSE
jgi:hypothetical protein